MGATSSSQRRQKRARGGAGYHYGADGSQHSRAGGGAGTAGSAYSVGRHYSRQQPPRQQTTTSQQPVPILVYNHPPTVIGAGGRPTHTRLVDMASITSSSQRRKSATSRTLLDRKCIFLGRYFARQFSQPVLQRLRTHVRQAKGTKTRIRLSTKGLTVGSKNSNVFKATKAPYEFFPLDDIHEIFVDNDLRSVLLVIKGLPDGHLELLTYKLTDELEARQYQQTFNEMVAMNGSRAMSSYHNTARVDMTDGTMMRTMPRTYHHTTTTTTTPTTKRRVANHPTEAYVYRIKSDSHSGPGTPASRRNMKMRHRSDGDALDDELRKQEEDRIFLQTMRARHSDLRDFNDNDTLDGPIRMIFNKDGVIETHGAASIVRDGELESFVGSDHDSGIQSKDQPEVVDRGLGTVRAQVNDYRTISSSTARSSSSHHHSESIDQTDYGNGYGNGYVSGAGRTSRSPTRSTHITHHVRRSESPAPSHAQSEGGWRVKMPWKRRSRSSDSQGGIPPHKWETASLMVGTHPRPLGKMYVPPNSGGPPEYLVMYPSLNKNHRTKSKSATRFEL